MIEELKEINMAISNILDALSNNPRFSNFINVGKKCHAIPYDYLTTYEITCTLIYSLFEYGPNDPKTKIIIEYLDEIDLNRQAAGELDEAREEIELLRDNIDTLQAEIDGE